MNWTNEDYRLARGLKINLNDELPPLEDLAWTRLMNSRCAAWEETEREHARFLAAMRQRNNYAAWMVILAVACALLLMAVVILARMR